MAPRDDSPEFSIAGNTLRVVGSLGTRTEQFLEQELARFLEAGHGEMTVDLSGIDSVSTAYFGALAVFLAEAKEAGRPVVILAGEGLDGLLKLADLGKLAEIRTVEP